MIIEGIFCSKQANVRKYFTHAIYVLAKSTSGYKSQLTARYFVNLLLQNLPSSEDKSKVYCTQFFDLLCKLIEETFANSSGEEEDGENSINFENLISNIVSTIKKHHSSEKRENLFFVDKTLVGLLNLCDRILAVRPELKEVIS